MRNLLLVLSLCGCPHATSPVEPVTTASPAPTNPVLAPSPLPFQMPQFDKITDADFAPAYDTALAEHTAEIAKIAHDPAPPTFDNTIVALERSGQSLTRVAMTFNNLNASKTDDALQALDEALAPKLSAHRDAILHDPDLFARVDAVFQSKDSLGLAPEALQLLTRTHLEFVRAGARLSADDKVKLEALNARLSTLETQFEQNNRNAMTDGGVVVDDVAELDGLSPEEISAAAEAATAKGQPGKWILALQNTTGQPCLASLTNRALRERVEAASEQRGAVNLPVVSEIVTIRAQKAALLGYPTFAAYALEDETAGTATAVDAILVDLGAAALAQAKREQAEIQAVIDREAKAAHAKTFAVQPWDWAYYAEKVRKEKYSFDESEVKPYFELDRVLNDGLFYSATQLYGVTFKERKDLPVYHPDVRVFEVDEADGTPIGLLLLDYFQRDGKSGGAWMDNYVGQSKLLGTKPVVVNNLNIPKPAPGQPVLLSFDEVGTMFHEFGHGVNGLFSNATYPTLSGTNTPPDFVEYPSQFNEMWARDPGVLAHYAKHYQTGEPMPKALFDKVLAAQNFGTGYGTLEYIAAAKLDMAWHEIPASAVPPADGVMAFEAAALKSAGLAFPAVPPRYHTQYFAHAFAGGYEAGYYAYIWSEVLARDTGAWFMTNGGMTRANGDKYRALVLSRGRIEEPSAMFEALYGKKPEVGPLLDYHGLAPAPK
jgi:peptidyl-dipeptidase Dcp